MRAVLAIALFATPAFADDDADALHHDELPTGLAAEIEIGTAMRHLPEPAVESPPTMAKLARQRPVTMLDAIGLRFGFDFGDANGLYAGVHGEGLGVVRG